MNPLTMNPLRLFAASCLLISGLSQAQNPKSTSDLPAYAVIEAAAAEVFENPNASKPAAELLSRFTPVKPNARAGAFIKITDVWGKSGWVRASDINLNARYVVANLPVTPIYRSADRSSSIVFEVNKEVALQALTVKDGWVQVRHSGGAIGFAPTSSFLQ